MMKVVFFGSSDLLESGSHKHTREFSGYSPVILSLNLNLSAVRAFLWESTAAGASTEITTYRQRLD